ncbi:MAG: tetratricopeptide repeat protein, partial [Phycisphaerae bacterium]
MSKRRSKRNQKHQPEPAEPPALATPSEPDWLPGLIVAAGIIAYFTSFAGTYVLDDLAHIQFSDKITSLTPLSKFFLHDRRPIVSLSLALNYALGKFDEWGYHAMNLAIHLAAALTLFGIVRQVLLREPLRKRYGAPAPWLAATVALLFVLHPLQTQAVTYIIQRAESLMGLFYLLTIYCLVRGDQSKLAPLWYLAAVAACAAGMSTKAVMVTAPVVTLAFDRTFLSGTLVRALRRRWLFYLGLAATWALLFNTKVVQSALNPNVTGPATIGFSIDEVTWWQYALSQPGVILRYLQLSIWPSGQCLDYDWPVAQGVIRIGLPLAAIALLIGATCWAWIRKPRLGFLGVWFFVILSPTSSFVPIKDLAFEHRMYLPLAAVIVLIVFAGYRALERCLPNAGGPGGRFVMAAVVVALAAPLGIATMKRNTVYESTVKMYQNVLKTSPENVRIWTNLGTAWRQEGNDDKALGCYRRAVEIDPYFASAHNNIGATLEEQGRLEEALQFFLLALKAEPKKAYRHSAYAKVL